MTTGRRFGSGMEFLQEQNKALGGSKRGSGFWKLWLKDGETAQFYFATDGRDMLVPLIHLKTVSLPGRKPFTIDILCAKTSADDETPCEFCAAPEVERDGKMDRAFPGPFPRMVAYVYVTAIFHPQRDPKGKWEPVGDAAGGTRYREDVNDFRLLIASYKLQDAIKEAFAGDVTEDDYDPATRTLMDRAYRMVRSGGTGGSAQTQLIPSTRLGYPDEIKVKAAELPPLFDTIEKEFTDAAPGRAKVAASGAVAPAPDDDQFDESIAQAQPGATESVSF